MADTCRIVALGGLGEVGKNMTVYECGDDIVVVDAGLAFPRDEHLGVDLVLPDFSYLRDRARSIRTIRRASWDSSGSSSCGWRTRFPTRWRSCWRPRPGG